LWSSGKELSRERRWETLELDSGAIRKRLRNQSEIRLNDVLAGVCLRTMADWNRQNGKPCKGLALWHPINIRQDAFEGFGNGSSRVRIYWEESDDPWQWAGMVRRQMDWSKQNGEWHVPKSALFRSPGWLRRPLVRAVLRRPWVDMGSMLFSHMERQGPFGERVLRWAERMEWVGMLDRRFPAGIVGASHGDQTWLTLCWDPALWSSQDAELFLSLYRKNLCVFLEGRP